MSALPYTIAWVGVADAPPPADDAWHLAWLGQSEETGVEDKTLCGLLATDDQLIAHMTPSEMKNARSGRDYVGYVQCSLCCDMYRAILYMRMEDGESVEDLRA